MLAPPLVVMQQLKKAFVNNAHHLFAKNVVPHISQVREDSDMASRVVILGLGPAGVAFEGEIHGFDGKGHAAINANNKVKTVEA